jgi:UDP-N-acetylglucosamine 2-epimerase (non-hydrolysing)
MNWLTSLTSNVARSHIAVFVGTRPEAVKLAPVIRALKANPAFRVSTVLSGQHDRLPIEVLREFDIQPEIALNVLTDGQSLAMLTSQCLTEFDRWISKARVDFSVVQGDTTTAMAGALSSFYSHVPVGHVEAGLRTYDLAQPFPEELNRQLISRIASLNFAPTPRSRDFLISEGIQESAVILTGNTVVDALKFMMEPQAQHSNSADHFQPPPEILVTMHRRENHENLQAVYEAVFQIAEHFPSSRCTILTHPNPAIALAQKNMRPSPANVTWSPPMTYPDFLASLHRAVLVISDSGGVQEEAVSLGKPVVVAREITERQEGQDVGLAVLCGCNTNTIYAESLRILTDRETHASASAVYGDGRAAQRIASSIADYLSVGL